MPTPDETSAPMSTHLALALTRYVRQLRKDGLPVPLALDELAAFLTLYVKSQQAAPRAVSDVDISHEVLVVRRLLITKAEAAERLGVSVRTVERLISAGKLPLVHVEGAARLRTADLETYVDTLASPDTAHSVTSPRSEHP